MISTAALALLPAIAVAALIVAAFSALSQRRILAEPDEHTLVLANLDTLPEAPPRMWDPMIRSLPISQAVYLMPGILADEVSQWLESEVEG